MTVVSDTDYGAAVDQSGRGHSFRFVQPHNAAFWLYVVLLSIGVVHFFSLNGASVRSFPQAFVLASVLWVLYLVPWVLFIRHEDMYDPEPAKLTLVGFVWGGFIATWVMALEANTAVISLVGKLGSPELARDWGPSIAAPFVEETAKGVGVVMLVLFARQHVRSSFDGAILGAFVGLGFQVLEDFSYSINAAAAAGPGNEAQAVFGQFISRGFMGGLWSHALYTGLVGAGIGYFVSRTDQSNGKRARGLLLPIGAAWLLHFVWDSPFVNGTTFTAVTGVAKFVIYPLIFVMAIRWATRRRREDLGVLLASEVSNGTLSADDVELLVMSRHERRQGLRHIKKEDGAAHRDERHRIRGARDLATALAKSSGAESDDVADARLALATAETVTTAATTSP
jgi:RsiW-degrading membrane proteinase PrsW (M82 family)